MLKKNIQTIEKLRGINRIYTKNSIQGTHVQEIMEKKAARLEWLKSFANVISRKATFEEVKSLIEQANRDGISTAESPEKQYLESMVQSAQAFFSQQRAIFEEKTSNINLGSDSLQNEFDRVDKCENFEMAEQLFSRIISRTKDLIQKKLSLSELEALAEKGKQLQIDVSAVTARLEAEIQRVKHWQSLKQPLKVSEFIEYMREMCSLAVFLPEMLEKLDRFEKCKSLHLRLFYFIKTTEHKKDKSKADAMVDESEEAHEVTRIDRMQLKDAKELKEKIENQEFKFEEEFHQLKDKIKHCEVLQQKLQKHLDGPLDPVVLKPLQKDTEKAAFTFSKLEEIQQKVIKH